MKNFFLTSRNRRRAARVRVSRRLGAEIRQAGRHVRASGGKRRGGLKLIPEIRKLARHPVRQPFKEQRSRELERREKRNSEKQGKKRTERKRWRGKKKKVSLALLDRQRSFFPFVHTFVHTRFRDTRIFPSNANKNEAISMRAVEVCVMIFAREREMERKGNSTEREREKDRLAKVLKKKKGKKKT